MNVRTATALFLGAMVFAACTPSSAPEPAVSTDPQAVQQKAVAELHALFDEEWERQLRESPIAATYLGDARYNDRWDDVSEDAYLRRHAADRAALERISAIPRASLPAAEQLNHELFRRQLELSIEGQRFRAHLLPLTQLSGIQTQHEILEVLRFETIKDYENWFSRLQGFGGYMDQTIALMRRGMAEGRLHPKVAMRRVSEQIAQQRVKDPEASPYFAPFRSYADTIPMDMRGQLTIGGIGAIEDTVLPAYERLQAFFDKEYLPACPEAVGISSQKDGAEWYAYLARYHTTTRLTPQEIHETGLREVKRIRTEMIATMRQTGFKSGLSNFFELLQRDRRFYFQTAEELLDGYRALTKRIDPELPRLFGRLPRIPYGVRALPESSARDAPSAYYYPPAADGSRAGYFYANTYQPETRPKWQMEALAAHEAVPGHHLQIALARELTDLPKFRRHNHDYTAFVEGWGLYAESLGGELGLYQDPYSKFGQLTYEMWRAARLVVDTGLHTKGWTRQRAIDYFKANAGKDELDIVNEVDRYIVWPGQALAYKIGALKIQELRADAEKRLGERFDIRGFHDVVLGSGAVPLDVLEAQVEAWVVVQAVGK